MKFKYVWKSLLKNNKKNPLKIISKHFFNLDLKNKWVKNDLFLLVI